jgi:microcystin-dependent protein
MPYIVNFTDSDNKTPITVYDNTSNYDTSITLPGRNVTGYGQIIAENFLHILENFASADAPVNPIEGQLWYDTQNGVLQLWDNTNWKAASNIQKGPTEPSVEQSKVGELWVDTTNQQLRIFTGARWLLVGPSESSIDGLRYGPAVETIADSDNNQKSILIMYIADQPVAIVSKDTFVPKIGIQGFSIVKSGINIATPATSAEEAEFDSIFAGGNLPRLIGTAQNADALNIAGAEVAASKFLRTDQVNTTEFGINVRSNSGITIGIDGNLNVSTSATAAKIYNSSSGSSIDVQTNRDGIPSTILRVIENRVGINVASPDSELDVDGNIHTTGSISTDNVEEALNFDSGSIRTPGGVAIGKSALIGNGLKVEGTTQTKNIVPETTESYDLGTAALRWNTIRAKTISADTIEGTIEGNITGNANTATNLKNVTSFSMTGDVIAPAIQFDGQVGSYSKVFQTELTANLINAKDEPFPNRSEKTDYILTYRPSSASAVDGTSGLLKQSRDAFVGDLGVPIGTVMPYAGAVAPYGYLLCDGAEVEQAKYPDLFDIIGTRYNGTAALSGVNTYRLPDMRGRFALGKHNMDNGGTVPTSGGAYVDAGGGEPSPSRVEGTEASTLASSSGQSSVSLTLGNLPEHTHNMQSNGIQYYALRNDTAISPPAVTESGGTAPGQSQFLGDSGGIKKPSTDFTLGSPVGIMNPFLTLNYIIRSGPPRFTTS